MSIPIEWLVIVMAVLALTFIFYNMGYQRGKKRALRDNRNDSKSDFKSQIIGKWKEIQNNATGSGPITYEFFENGAVISNGQLKIPDSETIQNIEIEGTWLIENVNLIVSITKSNFPALVPIGYTSKDEILAITDSTIKYITANGKIKSHSRA